MTLLPDWVKNTYLRLIDPVADWLVARHVHPNTITVFGTLCTVIGGIIFTPSAKAEQEKQPCSAI